MFCSRECRDKSEYVKSAIRRYHTGRKRPAETRERIRLAAIGRRYPKRDAIPELTLRSLLEQMNVTFDDHVPIEGVCQPDYVVRAQKVALFADGKYWHCDPRFYPDGPINSTQRFVVAKDKRQDNELRAMGWSVIRFWETDLKKNPGDCMRRLREVLCRPQ
ncbi:MAG: DUF559 domain-containing protein [Euryarchaeota archaeon]|nr:DUF559 domain-containing protein [Euryarchaeota archaeon]MDE1879222.1 DUF559 domain-containing protein [Euryarchaeota archaeon]MDE2044553.1 DUF559 domain-containing protein [Thermoplasmata archaeon]